MADLAGLSPRRLPRPDRAAAPATRILDLPVAARPREQLAALGVTTLTDGELLALLLRSGRAGRSALDLAHGLLGELGGLAGALRAEPERLLACGVGPVAAAVLQAAGELATRLARSRLPARLQVDRAECAVRYLALRYLRSDQEVMGALYLDRRLRLCHERELFRGTLDRAAVEPRAILREGLLRGAAAVLLFHTHPSGDPTPSSEDLAFTRRMVQAARIVGLELADHLIIGSPSQFVSLRGAAGAWDQSLAG